MDTLLLLALSGKGRITTMISPFFGALLGMALFLSTAQSFSIENHHTHPNCLSRQYLPNERTSLGFSNSMNHHLTGGDITSIRADNTNSGTRLGGAHFPSLHYNIDVIDPSDSDGDEDLARAVQSESLVPNIHQRFQSSMEQQHGWEGLDNIFSSPFAPDLGWNIYVPKGVSASVFSRREKEGSSPLVLTPDRKNHVPGVSSSEFLRSFLNIHRKWIEERILEYGVIVFRGFEDLEETGNSNSNSNSEKKAAIGKEILRALNPSSSSLDARNGFEFYMVSEDTNAKIEPITSTRKRGDLYNRNRAASPRRLVEIGAPTRLTDWRGIHDDLPPDLRRKLNEKDLLYKRTHHVRAAFPEILLPYRSSDRSSNSETTKTKIDDDDDNDDMTRIEYSDYDTTETKPSPWFRLFGSTNKKAFEKAYHQIVGPIVQHEEATGSFIDEKRFVSEAFRFHPHTNEKIWFELAHRYHWTSLPAELLADFERTKNPWILAKVIQEAALCLWKRLCGGRHHSDQNQNQNHVHNHNPESEQITVAFGDGTPISWWEMHQIRRAIKHNTAHPPWKPGDLLVVDGLSMGLQ